MIRVLIAEDVPLFRRGLRWTLEQMSDCAVIGEATDPGDILQAVSRQHPDVVFLNDGLTTAPALAIARLLFQHEQRGLFVLADPLTEENLFEYLVAGAAAYEPRWISPDDLASKLWRVSRGEYLISGESLAILHSERQNLPSPSALPPESDRCPLTPHEMQLLVAIAQGMSNKQIARLFALGEQAVHTQIAAVLQAVGVARRTTAVMVALRQGWLDFTRIEEGISPDAAQALEECARPHTRRKAPSPSTRSSLVRFSTAPQVGYRLQKAFCGKASCKKCRDGGGGHGPYWFAYELVNGKTVRRYVGKSLPAEVRAD